jgi:(S)-2-hydroxy-acid oxidase
LLGRRLNEFRNGFGMPKGMTYPNIDPDMDASNLEGGDNALAYGQQPHQPPSSPLTEQSSPKSVHRNEYRTYMDCKKENGVNWDEAISFVKANSNLQIWVKGRKFLLRTTLTLTLAFSIIFSFLPFHRV